MNRKYNIYKAAGIIIVEKKLLVTRETGKEYFIAPGGREEKAEDPKQTVIRELFGQVNIVVKHKDLETFGEFYAEAADIPGSWLKMDVFKVNSWEGEPTPSNGEEQIEEILWLTSDIPNNIKVGSIFEHEVIPRLKSLDLID